MKLPGCDGQARALLAGSGVLRPGGPCGQVSARLRWIAEAYHTPCPRPIGPPVPVRPLRGVVANPVAAYTAESSASGLSMRRCSLAVRLHPGEPR